MKPIQVEAGQHAPDVDEMVEKAGSMIEKLEMDNSQIHNITGVEPAPMTHYYTNQNQPTDNIEEITNKGGTGPENVTHIDANPHQSGSTLAVHENSAGGEGGSVESSARYGAGSSGVRKGIEEILGKKPPMGGGGPPGMDKPPLPGMDEGPGMGKPPLPGMDDGMDDDDDDDAETLGDRIKSLVDKLVDKSGDGGMGDGPPLPKGPPGPPGMGGGGPPMPPGGGGPPGPPMM